MSAFGTTVVLVDVDILAVLATVLVVIFFYAFHSAEKMEHLAVLEDDQLEEAEGVLKNGAVDKDQKRPGFKLRHYQTAV